ncbi:histone deacetylase family protein [Marinobacterium sp. D7]|uniref:histone deacetylase family protein n=1 Tax=Marinobacterium ramblicola TaxID=2849041 RepID=UPI001C2CF6FC|nr:histone deacetylase family protein [Marinobacterium ramblicola]MBV1789836.1 histone deacetylase family protein [Marinobacterium ramblicola]
MTTALITHPDCELHQMAPGHPESPERLRAIRRQLTESGLIERLELAIAEPATREQLQLVHPAQYIDAIADLHPLHGLNYADPDTALNPHSLRAAQLATGAVIQATGLVFDGRVDNAFCAVRPPGHHAEHDAAMGFCLFNNIAIGAAWALEQPGIERVAVLDFDVHHGNGTVDIFKDRPEVLVCSSFQYPFYPFRFQDVDRPNIVNTPLPAGTDGPAFRQAIERDWLPALQRHRPDMIFVSAGFDAHRDDPLAELLLEDEDFGWLGELIVDAGQRYCGGRIVSVLEGGYNLAALGRSVEQYLKALI